MSGVWVFGYGSLVDPVSFGHTLGRRPRPGVDFFEAEVDGFGRRWNYGVMHSTGRARGQTGAWVERTIVALGVVEGADETVNGVVAWVADEELGGLDLRERHYDRVDVTRRTSVGGATADSEPVVMYVPRAEAIAHYEAARDAGTAAIERRYWDLVESAFAAFGAEARARYLRSTPDPDVPILDLVRE
jgi:cation transport regulator ChaC